MSLLIALPLVDLARCNAGSSLWKITGYLWLIFAYLKFLIYEGSKQWPGHAGCFFDIHTWHHSDPIFLFSLLKAWPDDTTFNFNLIKVKCLFSQKQGNFQQLLSREYGGSGVGGGEADQLQKCCTCRNSASSTPPMNLQNIKFLRCTCSFVIAQNNWTTVMVVCFLSCIMVYFKPDLEESHC